MNKHCWKGDVTALGLAQFHAITYSFTLILKSRKLVK